MNQWNSILSTLFSIIKQLSSVQDSLIASRLVRESSLAGNISPVTTGNILERSRARSHHDPSIMTLESRNQTKNSRKKRNESRSSQRRGSILVMQRAGDWRLPLWPGWAELSPVDSYKLMLFYHSLAWIPYWQSSPTNPFAVQNILSYSLRRQVSMTPAAFIPLLKCFRIKHGLPWPDGMVCTASGGRLHRGIIFASDRVKYFLGMHAPHPKVLREAE